MNKIVRLEQKKIKRKEDKECPWGYRGFVIQRRDRAYNYTWTAINKQGKEVLVDRKLKNLCLKIDKLGTGLTNMDKTARLEVAVLMLEQRIEALEDALRSIRQISQETLQDKNERNTES